MGEFEFVLVGSSSRGLAASIMWTWTDWLTGGWTGLTIRFVSTNWKISSSRWPVNLLPPFCECGVSPKFLLFSRDWKGRARIEEVWVRGGLDKSGWVSAIGGQRPSFSRWQVFTPRFDQFNLLKCKYDTNGVESSRPSLCPRIRRSRIENNAPIQYQ